MAKNFIGLLQKDDPLYDYLKYDIQPQLTDFIDDPSYSVYELSGSNVVYQYEENHTGAKAIGKYFYSERDENREDAAEKMEKEYDALETVRSLGFDCEPFYVARPLGKNSDLGELLVIEYCEGELLSSVIRRAINENNDALLFDKLAVLAHFFAELHNRSATEDQVDFSQTCQYMDKIIDQCLPLFSGDEADEFHIWCDSWRCRPEMWEDCQVLVHGDATPENFMFSGEDGLETFDMERCMYTDRIFDVGRIAGELKHFFLMNFPDTFAAEPFIGHFLWEYATHFPDRENAFDSVTRRVPFYMGLTLLRIARNFWIDRDYRLQLIGEARKCFQEDNV
ncbi:MAG: aminoglycoside phosphotransferase family protein [Alphaproteobacteria bacterium]|nr:aminoglycoside phosphotransferase family protein [Alphaproteobacteria bacterium]